MRLFILLFLVFLTSGCSTFFHTSKVTGPDGTPHRLVKCTKMKDCYKWATKACEGKYAIINSNDEVENDSDGQPVTTHIILTKCEI